MAHDELRLHLVHANLTLRLVALAGCPLPEGIVRHIKRLRELGQRWRYVERRKVKRELFNADDQLPM
jgi:hypothetical protein